MSEQLKLGDSGTVCSCNRCGVTCLFNPLDAGNVKPITTGVTKERVVMLKRATTPEGLCSTCAVREWFYIMRHSIPVEVTPAMLLLPHVQEQFAATMRSFNADVKPGEINWQKLADEWDLPIPSAGTGIDRKLLKLDDDPMWQHEPPRRRVDMRPTHPANEGVGVDDLSQLREARNRGLVN